MSSRHLFVRKHHFEKLIGTRGDQMKRTSPTCQVQQFESPKVVDLTVEENPKKGLVGKKFKEGIVEESGSRVVNTESYGIEHQELG